MSITDELREFVGGRGFGQDAYTDRAISARFCEIADRIDEAHLEESVANIVKSIPDGVLKRHGLIRLPVDSCGEPWRLGDRAKGVEIPLTRICLNSDGSKRLEFGAGYAYVMVVGTNKTTLVHSETPFADLANRIRDAVVEIKAGNFQDYEIAIDDLLKVADKIDGQDHAE